MQRENRSVSASELDAAECVPPLFLGRREQGVGCKARGLEVKRAAEKLAYWSQQPCGGVLLRRLIGAERSGAKNRSEAGASQRAPRPIERRTQVENGAGIGLEL